jgi:hypothetical protein
MEQLNFSAATPTAGCSAAGFRSFTPNISGVLNVRGGSFRIVAIAGVDEIYENTAKRNQTDLRHAA